MLLIALLLDIGTIGGSESYGIDRGEIFPLLPAYGSTYS
jgi:hypothetical protein